MAVYLSYRVVDIEDGPSGIIARDKKDCITGPNSKYQDFIIRGRTTCICKYPDPYTYLWEYYSD